MKSGLMKAKEVAQFLGISIRQLFNIRNSDKDFPGPIIIGKVNRWGRDEIVQYLENKSR